MSSVFESFNARGLEPEQVARTFAPPRQYSQLVKPTHALVVGPRGSGKTTLLKMLQGPALESWAHPRANEFRARITFTGVFIPTDVSWNAQLSAVGGSRMGPDAKELLAVATFTTHVLRQFIGAVHYRVAPPSNPNLVEHRRAPLTPGEEAVLVKEIAAHWMLKPTIPSLLALHRALAGRLMTIATLAGKEALLDDTGRLERLSEVSYLNLPVVESLSFALDVFQELSKLGREKWALLFDELELAPEWLRRRLVSYIRSVDNRLIFKLSMSPYSKDAEALDSPTAPMADSDFELIRLWYAHKEDGYSFCRALLRSMLTDLNKQPDLDPIDLFGRSEFETVTAEWLTSGTAYQPGSRIHRRFHRLTLIDPSFSRYLETHGIDIAKLHEVSGPERAADLRKVTSIVAVREAFRAPDRTSTMPASVRTRIRSRKNPDLYSGAATLFAMVEGNPRWFIRIVGSLLTSHYFEGAPISPSAQAIEIANAANRFRALLRTIPTSPLSTDQPRGALSLLDPIGRYFFRAVVIDDFNPDPPGSFIVDANVTDSIAESLGRVLNAGAIVYVPDRDSEGVLGSVRGKRFRLSYLLAAHYRIPIRLGRAVSLNTILRAVHTSEQQDLLGYPNEDTRERG